MLRYASKLTRAPAEVEEEDVVALREAGFGDLDVLYIVEVVGYFDYADRVADGGGISLEGRIPV